MATIHFAELKYTSSPSILETNRCFINAAVDSYRTKCLTNNVKLRREIETISSPRASSNAFDDNGLLLAKKVKMCSNNKCGCKQIGGKSLNARVFLESITNGISKTAANLFLSSLLFFKNRISKKQFVYTIVYLGNYGFLETQIVCAKYFMNLYNIAQTRLKNIQKSRRDQLEGKAVNPFAFRDDEFYEIYAFRRRISFIGDFSKLWSRKYEIGYQTRKFVYVGNRFKKMKRSPDRLAILEEEEEGGKEKKKKRAN